MRKILIVLSLTVFSVCNFLYASCPVQVIMTGSSGNNNGGEEPKEPNPKGRRTAPAPILIEIDFESLSISGPEILDEVESYEIWDDSGVNCLCVTTDASSFVETLSLLEPQTDYLIVMRTSDKTLSGSIFLN